MMTLIPLVAGDQVAFWVCAPIMVVLALGMVVARKPVHSAICIAGVMIGLAVLYAAQDAPFLFVVQIIVYTGAILMLFLFVVMLVGVDSRDSFVETLKHHRVASVLAALGFAALIMVAFGFQAFPTEPAVRRQPPGHRGLAVHAVRLHLRGHRGPAHHRRARRHGARTR